MSLTKIISSILLLIVCTSCKTSYNVPIPIGGWVIFSGGGGVVEIPGGSKKKDSLPILGLQRLATLLRGLLRDRSLFIERRGAGANKGWVTIFYAEV